MIVSSGLRRMQREVAALGRRITGGRPTILYFHQADDPYSALTAQILPGLAAGYDVAIEPFLVPPPGADANPDAPRLAAYGRFDASRLANAHGLDFPPLAVAPDAARVTAAQCALAASLAAGRLVQDAAHISQAFWARGDQGGRATMDPGPYLAAGDARRRELGHYSGATFYFEGEWYWGIDRLPYLEARLAAFRRGAAPIVSQLAEPRFPALHSGATIDFYPSLRSPYTYLAAARVRALAERHGASLRIKPVLPMVMRGLPVPRAKRMYIVRDTKREAERLGMPFGLVADPVGAPTERGLAVLFPAIAAGKGAAFLESFLSAAWAEGIDAGTDTGLQLIADRAGIGADSVAASLADDGWRAQAEANRLELLELGLWGVPSFRVAGLPGFWGQDRLWAIEDDLRQVAASQIA